MERLTRGYLSGNYSAIEQKCDCVKSSELGFYKAINKLGQLEDIEEGLGIDLITLFKALTQGFWIRRPRGTRPQNYSYEFVNPKDDDDIHNEVSLDIYHKRIYYYDNYMQWRCGARRFAYDLKTYRAKKGFAWALTKEELEWKD